MTQKNELRSGQRYRREYCRGACGERVVGFNKSGAVQWAQEEIMLWTIFAVLLILWLLGFTLSVGGSLIHLLLVVAFVVLVINLVSGRRGTA